MSKASIFLAITAILILVSAKFSQANECLTKPAYVQNGFLSGAECTQKSTEEMRLYMIGFVNGVLVSTLFGAPSSCIKRFHQCMVDKTDFQLAEVFLKWLREHPERWHEGCHTLSFAALRNMCDRLGVN